MKGGLGGPQGLSVWFGEYEIQCSVLCSLQRHDIYTKFFLQSVVPKVEMGENGSLVTAQTPFKIVHFVLAFVQFSEQFVIIY